MREFEIRLGSVKDVQDFVALATSRPFLITVRDEQMLPVYTVKKEDAEDRGWDFSWRVDFTNDLEKGLWHVGTFGFKSRLQDGDYTVAQMIHEEGVTVIREQAMCLRGI